jgi:hypothetical protein
MPTGKHYFIEQTEDRRYAVRAKGTDRASGIFDTQRAAIDHAHELNLDDHPNAVPCSCSGLLCSCIHFSEAFRFKEEICDEKTIDSVPWSKPCAL